MPPMYSGENDEDADVTTPLVPRRGERGGNDSSSGNGGGKSAVGGILVNRIIIILLLVIIVCLSIYYQSQLTTLDNETKDSKTKIDDLKKLVDIHSDVIERFNQSVTNSDVLAQLNSLKTDLLTTRSNLELKLGETTKNVDIKLNATLSELAETVSKAEDDIAHQVDHVKKDVEQYVILTQDQFSMENSFMVYQIAGTLTLLSCLISMWHMTAHLRKMKQPVVQRKILAILWMSPIYAITSWFSLVFPSAEGYLAIVKDGYEAYIIYQFLSFCISVLGKGDRNSVVDLLAKRADHLTPPFRLFGICRRKDPYEGDNRALADAILLQCQVFAMQFVFFRPLTTTAIVVMAKFEYYGVGNGPNDYRSPQFYITLIQNLSVFIAFGGLLKFYHAVDKDLQWCRPFAKFLCIKGVVFMTFWQGLAITVMSEMTDVGGQNADEWAKSAQNFLICLEMLLFSIAHFYCFPTEEWEEGYRAQHSKANNFGDSLAFGDFVQDLKLIMRSSKSKKKSKKQPTTVPEGNENEDADAGGSCAASISSFDEEDVTPGVLAQRIQDSLRDSSDDEDEEVAKAKKRFLVQVLQDADDDEEDIATKVKRNEVVEDYDSSKDQEQQNDVEEEEYNSQHCTPYTSAFRSDDNHNHDDVYSREQISPTAPVSETSGLLHHNQSQGNDDNNMSDMLRTSLFTNMANIAGSQTSNQSRNSDY